MARALAGPALNRLHAYNLGTTCPIRGQCAISAFAM